MYTIEQLATMTGLTTRTLRNYLKSGLLQGTKNEGIWQFSEEQIGDFVTHPTVRPSIQAKHNAIVYDFLAGCDAAPNEACVLLNLTAEKEEARAISDFFCNAVSRFQHIRFAFTYQNRTARIILKGPEAGIQQIMQAYYSR